MWKRHRVRLKKQRLDHELRYLFLEVTRKCNLACLYCGSSCTGKPPEDEMPISRWIEIVEQVASDFDSKKIMVAVTGGEPLLKEGILDLFARLSELGFRYGMVTNGQLLDADMAKRLVEVGMGSISVSMDALPEENDRLRGRGSSEKVMQAIRHLQEAGFSGKLEVISTITKPVVPSLEEMRKFVASMKVPLWRAAPVMPIGRAAEHPELIPDSRDVRSMLEWMRQSRKDSYEPQPEMSEEGYLGNRFEGLVRPFLVQCRAGTNVAGIRYDGRIAACPELTDAFDQGHMATDRFKDIWDKEYQIMRDRSWTKKGICKDCEHFEVCQGGSLHLYEDTKSDILRCLYKMCKEVDGQYMHCSGCEPRFYGE